MENLINLTLFRNCKLPDISSRFRYKLYSVANDLP